MKTLTTFNANASDNPHVDIVRLVTIEFDGLTLYLCDRVFGSGANTCVFNSQLYDPLILSWGSISNGRIDPITYETTPSEASFVVDNNTPVGGFSRFAEMFRKYDPHYSTVTITEIFNGASAADGIDIFSGKIEDIIGMITNMATVTCSGYELEISKKFDHEILETSSYPSADPDDVGKMFPQVYGTCNRVPCVAVSVGGLATLSEDITSISTTIKLTDASAFPSSGTIVVDDEQITYTGKTGNNIDTGVSRAANSTLSVEHKKGAVVGEVVSEFIYALGHPVNAINAVYVDNVLQQSSEYTAYTGQTGDQHATYTDRAIVSFSAQPKIKYESVDTEFNISREATNVPIGRPRILNKDGTVADYDTSTEITFQTAPSGTLSDIYVEYTYELRSFGTPSQEFEFYIDGTLVADYRNSTLVEYTTSPLRVKKTTWPTTAVKTTSWRDNNGCICLTVLSATVYCTSTIDDIGQRGKYTSENATNMPLGRITSNTTVDSANTITWGAAPSGTLSDVQITYKWKYQKWGDPILPAHHLTVDGVNVAWINSSGTATALMPSTFTVLKGSWQTSVSKTPSMLPGFRRGESLIIESAVQSCYTDDYTYDVKLSGNSMADAVIGGIVSVDVSGWQDDALGTYTGVADSLIERPDHILKHILMNRCGLTSSEIDSTSYNAAGTFYAANSYTLGVPILQKPNARSLINRIAKQSRSMEYWEAGVHHLVHMPDTETTDKTIEANRIDAGQLWLKYTDRVDIENTFVASYNRNWSGYDDDILADKSSVAVASAASVAHFGTLQGEKVSLNYITSAAMAQDLINWKRYEQRWPRLIVQFSGGYYFIDIECGDILSFTFTTDDVFDKALLKLVTTSQQFRVIDKVRVPPASIQLEAIAIDAYNYLLLESGDYLLLENGYRTILE